MKVLKFFGRLIAYIVLTIVSIALSLVGALMTSVSSLVGIISYGLAIILTLGGIILLFCWGSGIVDGITVLVSWIFISLVGCWFLVGIKFGAWLIDKADDLKDLRPSIIPRKKYDFSSEVVAEFEKSTVETPAKSNAESVDDLIKFKQLFDDGVITEEEFSLKKKQLLGI